MLPSAQLDFAPYLAPDRKRAARLAVKRAMAQGLIVAPAACACCGDERRVIPHHDDYERPLDVVFLCFRCHKTGHGLWGFRGYATLAEAVAA